MVKFDVEKLNDMKKEKNQYDLTVRVNMPLSLAVCKIIKGYFSGHKMEQNRFHLNIRKQFFAEHWNRFLREVVESSKAAWTWAACSRWP